MQTYLESAPTRRYQRWAEQFWSFEAAQAGQATILPDARSDIILRYVKDGTRIKHLRPDITSPSRTPFVVPYDVNDCWIGVRLRPEQTAAIGLQAPSFFEQDRMTEAQGFEFLANQSVNIHALISTGAIKAALELAISNLPFVPFPNWVVSSIDRFHLSGGRVGIAQISAASSVSERHFRRAFMKAVHVSPKVYGAIIRFHRALRLITGSRLTISDAAFEAGYADQAHMTRAFQEFGGFSPGNIPKQLSLPGLPI